MALLSAAVVLLLVMLNSTAADCPAGCTCGRNALNCSGLAMVALPQEMHRWLQHANLSYNNLTEVLNLQEVRLDHNELTAIPSLGSAASSVRSLHLDHNRIRSIEASQLQPYVTLETLDLSFNDFMEIQNGYFPRGLRIKELCLGSNRISALEPGAFDNLSQSLRTLNLTGNRITELPVTGFRLPRLTQLVLSYNNLTRLDKGSFANLWELQVLQLSHNYINHIAKGAFKGLNNLRVLTLFGNEIQSVTKKTFKGLETLEHLNLGDNAIYSIEAHAFARMKSLQKLHINSDRFLCNCKLQWLPQWLVEKKLQSFVVATCGHPESLKNKSIFAILPESFACDNSREPWIVGQPETKIAVLGQYVSFSCMAASNSSSPMMFAWKKNNAMLYSTDINNFLHVRAKDQEVMEWTSVLHLWNVTVAHEGQYHCAASNRFGSTSSNTAQLTVHVPPLFTKTPHNITSQTGMTVQLECAAEGHPRPQITWQKDRGSHFPVAQEHGMRVTPVNDSFFIMDVKIEDMGLYSCTAQNSAGSVFTTAALTVLETPALVYPPEDHVMFVGETMALQCKATGSPQPRITWLKGGQPLVITKRHHLTFGNQLLMVRNVCLEDAGRYTCEASNMVGMERAHSQVSILKMGGCKGRTDVTAVSTMLSSIMVTSLIWISIIYYTMKKSGKHSAANTGNEQHKGWMECRSSMYSMDDINSHIDSKCSPENTLRMDTLGSSQAAAKRSELNNDELVTASPAAVSSRA